MENDYVLDETCKARHDATNGRLTRVEKDIDKQWDVIDGLRKALQRQAVQIALIVGGVSGIVQLVSIATQIYLSRPHP